MTTFQERVGAFEHAVTGSLGVAQIRLHRAFGVSNSAKVIEGGIQLAGVNLERYSTPEAFVLCSCLRFAPNDEVLFAVVVRDDLVALERRLGDMRCRGEAGADDVGREFAARNNNVVVYLAPGGRLLLRNKGYWEALSPEDGESQGPVLVDAIHVACSSGAGPGNSGQGAGEFVRYLDVLAGEAQVIDHTASPPVRPLRSWGVVELRRAVEALGGYHPDNGIESLHQGLCLGAPGKVAMIQGPSGSGKTLLARRYAEAIGARVVACTGQEGSVERLLLTAGAEPEATSQRPCMLLLDGANATEAARAARVWRAARNHALPVEPAPPPTTVPERYFLVVTLDDAASAPTGVVPVVSLPAPDVPGFVHYRLRVRGTPAARPSPEELDVAMRCLNYAEAEALLTTHLQVRPLPATR